jgi:hypothetical protein
MERVVDALVRPQAADRHDPVLDLAARAEVLRRHMGGVRARLAVAGVVDDQDPVLMRGSGWITRQPSNRHALTASASQLDSERKNCSWWTGAAWASTIGSAPAKTVSVLARSRGNSSP